MRTLLLLALMGVFASCNAKNEPLTSDTMMQQEGNPQTGKPERFERR